MGYSYFVTTSTKRRLPVFSDPVVSRIVLETLKWLDEQGKVELIAAVIMPDHIHFVARLRNVTLPALMQSLKGFTSRKINALLGREGPLWEPRYYEHALRTDEELLERVKYILQNPVRKGLVDDIKDYPHWYCIYEV